MLKFQSQHQRDKQTPIKKSNRCSENGHPLYRNREPVYRITPNNSTGELFFEVLKKGELFEGGGELFEGGELLFRVCNFAKKFTFSVQVGISHDDENGIGIWQRITAPEQGKITLLALWLPTTCLELFQTTL